MIYKEVPSSSVQPLSAFSENISFDAIERFFSEYFFKKGQSYYSEFKSSAIQSNSTFLKDLINNLNTSIKDKNIDDTKKNLISAVCQTLNIQLKLLEETFSNIDNNTFNAVICGALLKHLKRNFS
jgi:hypothetical protein